MELTPEQRAARAFVRGVASLRTGWRQQPLSELRESFLDVPTRQALADLARGCSDLLESHPARWTLDALMGLHLDIPSPPPTSERESVSKEQAIDWIDMVCDALKELYEPPEAAPASELQPRRRVVTVTLADKRVVSAPRRAKLPPKR